VNQHAFVRVEEGGVAVRGDMSARASLPRGHLVRRPKLLAGIGVEAHEFAAARDGVDDIPVDRWRRSIAQDAFRDPAIFRPKYRGGGLARLQLEHESTDEQAVAGPDRRRVIVVVARLEGFVPPDRAGRGIERGNRFPRPDDQLPLAARGDDDGRTIRHRFVQRLPHIAPGLPVERNDTGTRFPPNGENDPVAIHQRRGTALQFRRRVDLCQIAVP